MLNTTYMAGFIMLKDQTGEGISEGADVGSYLFTFHLSNTDINFWPNSAGWSFESILYNLPARVHVDTCTLCTKSSEEFPK